MKLQGWAVKDFTVPIWAGLRRFGTLVGASLLSYLYLPSFAHRPEGEHGYESYRPVQPGCPDGSRRLQSAIDEAMAAVAADDEELSRLGLSKDEFLAVRFEVREEGGFIAEGILLAIAVGAGGNLAADATKALWNEVLGRVRDRRGDDAVGPEKKPDGEDGHVSR